MSDSQNLLMEIGVEELPASYVDSAMEALPTLVSSRLKSLRLSHGAVHAYGTPRRVAILVEQLATRQPDLDEEVLGPPSRVAYDGAGRPTKAADAFAKKLGCAVEDLSVVETPKGPYVRGKLRDKGKPAAELLGTMLAEACAQIAFRKSMRWSDGDVTFGRPVRWLLALFGETVVDFGFAGLASGNVTYGHRFLAPQAIIVTKPSVYLDVLRTAHVIADRKERETVMLTRLKQACDETKTTLIDDPFLVGENRNLVEEPYVVVGGFDNAFLELPEDVILAVAKGHQRYFGARGADGRLAPIYLAVAGTAESLANVRRGNDRVMRARLSDAQFFFNEDLKVPLQNRRAQLKGIVFQDRLGTVLDKVERVEKLVQVLGGMASLPAQTVADAVEGASIAKCDLSSFMVGEFPELQGEMGRVYALKQGRRPEVADVIRGHYQPKGASDETPSSDASALVGLADRVDTLVGCFAVGLSPTGAADPYALRRACLGALRTVLDRGYGLSLRSVFALAFKGFEDKKLELDEAATVDKLSDFFRDRLRGLLVERFPNDVVDACLAAGHDRPTDLVDRVIALEKLDVGLRTKAGEVFKRATNIAKDAPAGDPVEPTKLDPESHATETAVYRALGDLDNKLRDVQRARDYPQAFAAMAAFAPLLGAFFEDVFVMTDNAVIRENRLRLMRAISQRCSGIAHFNLLT